MRFQDKVAIVTGAASGIGLAVVARLKSEGAIVVGVDVNDDVANDGGMVASVAREDDVKRVVADVVARHGKLDVLVNMAGILRSSPTEDTSVDAFRHVIETNLVGTFLMCRECLPHLRKTKGAIVNAASTSALFGHPYMAAYAASKGGVAAMTKALAWELIKEGVRVNAVAPGGVMTPMTAAQANAMDGLDMSLFMHLMRPDGQLGQPEHIASVVALLASDDGAYMTGEIVRVDGGTHS